MMLSRPQQSQTHYSQHSRHPYNPYPQTNHQPQCPQYTLQAQTPPTVTTASASSSPGSSSTQSPPPDMLFALERLLMGISPFPPTIPTLAKPTCPSLDDLTLTEESTVAFHNNNNKISPTHPQPTSTTALSTEQSFGSLDRNNRPSTIPAVSQPHQPLSTSLHHLDYRRSGSHSSSSSGSPPPPTSPSNISSSSPMYGMESDHDLPYWSPSTPTLSINHHRQHHPQKHQQHWSAGSSPLSPLNHQDSAASTAAAWGYSLFEPTTTLPTLKMETIEPHSGYSHHNHSHNQHVSFHHRSHGQKSFSNNSLAGSRAAESYHHSPRHAMSDVRSYESGIRHSYYSPRHYRTTTNSSSTSSSASPASNNNNHSSSNTNNSGNNHSSNNNSNANNRISSGSNDGNNNNNNNTRPAGQQTCTRGEPKSFPCQICTKPFPTRTQLKSHMAIHVDNFPFPCPYTGCDLHFKRKHDLRRHVDAKHALIKKYLCSGGCGEGFGRRDQMLRHLKRGHCQLKPEGDPARSVHLQSSGSLGGGGSLSGEDATATTACVVPSNAAVGSSRLMSQPYQYQQQQHSHAHQQQQQQQQQQLRLMNLSSMPLSLS
ncbi:hypothetical protein BGX29_010233 [Mortierella sp. GBA35]|nr:hypothetical protein BGX29_010233 [Mortierella sp. GBA35]